MKFTDCKNETIPAIMKVVNIFSIISSVIGIIVVVLALIVSGFFRQSGVVIMVTIFTMVIFPMFGIIPDIWQNKEIKEIALLVVQPGILVVGIVSLIKFIIDDDSAFITTLTLFGLPIIINVSLSITSYILSIVAYIMKNKVIAKEKRDSNNYNILIQSVGRKFFVKYYYKLRDFSELDVIDEITEAYSENAKRSRIRNGKKIFTLGLEKLALNEISNDNEKSDEETRQKARTILKELK